MAGYVIHLAVAEEYIRRHKNDIKNYDKFIQGVIYPDSVQDKSITHYGEKSRKVHLKKFLQEHDMTDCFDKGYFLHLVTDYLFYNKFLKFLSKEIYNDYDKTNSYLINKYNVKLPDNIKNQVFYKDGNTKSFTLEEISEFIEETAKNSIEHIKKEVMSDNEFWTTIINIKHL